jgi:hypothetical protein
VDAVVEYFHHAVNQSIEQDHGNEQ